MSPNGQHCNQIDQVAVNGKYKRSVLDARVFRGADVGIDHNLVVIRAKFNLHRTGKKVSTCVRYETCKLKSKEIIEKFKIELKNLVVIRAKFKLHKTGKKVSTCARYEACKLKSKEIIEKFKIELKNMKCGKAPGACFTKELTITIKFYPAHYSLIQANLKTV
jgi:hypothetical protein